MRPRPMRRVSGFRLAPALLLVLLLSACSGATDPSVPPPAPTVDLVDPQYPPALAGDPGWNWHTQSEADLDGDGVSETVHVIARVERIEREGSDEFAWDDGQPWQVYIEAADGDRTHVYSRWVQLGWLRAAVAEEQGVRSLIILEEQGAGLRLFQVAYRGPGDAQAEQLAGVPLLRWVPGNP